jgi:hypothetical protein
LKIEHHFPEKNGSLPLAEKVKIRDSSESLRRELSRTRESRMLLKFWIPAFAGMT